MARHRTFRTRFLCSLIVSFVLFLSAASVDSASGANETITIYPSTPSFAQPFFVAVSGQWATSCVPAYEAVAVLQTVVRLTARTPGPLVECQAAPTDWGFSVLIPAQQPNYYQAEIIVFSGITGNTLSTTRQEFEIIGGLQVIPPLPLATEDVTLRLAGLSSDSCVPRYLSHEVVGENVTVEAQIPDLACGQVPTPWQMEAALGQHPAGTYQVELFVTDHRHSPPQRAQLREDSFVIAERLWTYYLPLWGCFGADISPSSCVIQIPQRMTP